MPTQHQFRVILVVPVARIPAVVNWIRANVDDSCVDDLGPALNATGDAGDPTTHRWQNAAWTAAECRQLLFRMCNIANLTPPTAATWNGWNKRQKIDWFATVRDSVYSAVGVYVAMFDNEGIWRKPSDVLETVGLKTITIRP